MNFWEKLSAKGGSSSERKKPIFILAPMDGVTDTVFRQIVGSVGSPDVFFTEFVPVDALFSEGRERALRTLKFTEKEKPIVAQLWGTDPEKFYEATKLMVKLGFDGIDINMGCPDKSAVKTGACAALIDNPKKALEIIFATKKGAGKLPVSVKTRIGFKEIQTEKWIANILETKITALTVHLRTASEMSKPPAHWEEMPKIIGLKDKISPETLIIGNGDVRSLKEATYKYKKYTVDGIMIGRGIFENVWVFNESVIPESITPEDKIKLLIKHLELFKATYQGKRPFEQMKKFVKCYVNNFKGAVDVREQLMETKSLDELIVVSKKLYVIESHHE